MIYGKNFIEKGSDLERDTAQHFVWLLPLDLSGMGGSTSSYATAGIAPCITIVQHKQVQNVECHLWLYSIYWLCSNITQHM
jgi:hypothetical protein